MNPAPPVRGRTQALALVRCAASAGRRPLCLIGRIR